jgi:hypothetical protein
VPQLLLAGAVKNAVVPVDEVLRAEYLFFKDLRDFKQRVLFDAEGRNLFPDYKDFTFIDSDATLDVPENFDAVSHAIASFISEK